MAEMVLAALVEALFCFSAAMKVAVRSAWSTVSNLVVVRCGGRGMGYYGNGWGSKRYT